ncbi:MAG: hypothetical protein M0D55_16640 [Elusimicrobiota bacterium]|nr:MAG: hypothetical protein M0D55_16640 [Elusimicrobiota bacterium]
MPSSADGVLDRELDGNSRAADALRGLVIAGIVYSAEGRLSSLADLLRLARRERGGSSGRAAPGAARGATRPEPPAPSCARSRPSSRAARRRGSPASRPCAAA